MYEIQFHAAMSGEIVTLRCNGFENVTITKDGDFLTISDMLGRGVEVSETLTDILRKFEEAIRNDQRTNAPRSQEALR